jgi:hypothetical protein
MGNPRIPIRGGPTTPTYPSQDSIPMLGAQECVKVLYHNVMGML